MSLMTALTAPLKHPSVYIWVQRALGADRLRRICIDRYARLAPGERVLDLGCGPGYIRDLMPDVDYVGFDTAGDYIEFARRRYAGRGEFHCEVFSERHVAALKPFDAILLLGVLHHLDDEQASGLMELLGRCLRDNGRIVTLDPCFTPDQSRAARFVAESDRGRFVRTADAYDALVAPHFGEVSAEVLHNVCRIPSTERIMVLRAPRRAAADAQA